MSVIHPLLVCVVGVGMIELIDHKSVPDPLLLLSFTAHEGYVHSCAFGNDGLRLATGGSDNQVCRQRYHGHSVLFVNSFCLLPKRSDFVYECMASHYGFVRIFVCIPL